MYVFRAGCLALEYKLACNSLRRPPLLLPVLPVILCVGLWFCGLFSVRFGMFVGQLTCEPSCGRALLHVASDTTRRHSLRAHFLTLWCSQSLHPLCGSVPRASCSRVCCRSQLGLQGTALHLIGWVSCSWLLQENNKTNKESFLVEDCTTTPTIFTSALLPVAHTFYYAGCWIFALILSVMGFYFNLDMKKDNSCLSYFPLFLVITDVSSVQDTWYFLSCDSCTVV